jgi:Vacuolar protein sorting-associated protein 62/MAC/Perforin domain
MSVLEAPADLDLEILDRASELVRTSTADPATTALADVPEIPGLTVLGFGYDIFDLYADPRSAISPLFNFPPATDLINVGNRAYRVPPTVKVLALAQGERSLQFGDTITEFQQQFSLRSGLSGSYGFFSASIETEYNRNVIENAEWQFITIRDSAASWLLDLGQNEKLLPYIDPDFQRDLNDPAFAPEKLFGKYGSHFVASALIGGSAIYNCYVSRRLSVQQTDSETQVKAGYSWLTGSVNFQTGVGLKTDYKTFQSTYNSNLLFKGGDLGKGFEMADQDANGGFPAWAATVNDNPVLVDFDKRSLRPVWQLATSAARRDALERYYQDVFLPSHGALAGKPMVPELEGFYTTEMSSVYKDEGSNAKWNVEFFRPTPDKIPAGYFCLGHYAQGGASYQYNSKPFNSILLVKDLGLKVGGKPALAAPVAYSQVWNDKGSHAKQDGSIWRPTPPEGYVALGYVVRRSYDNQQPSLDAMRCVRADLADRAGFGNLLWKSGGNYKVSIYDLVPNAAYGRRTGCFHAQPNYDAASGVAWSLMASALKS